MGRGAIKLAAVSGAFLGLAMAYAQAAGTEKPRKWVDSFNAYKSYIRPLSPAESKACESQLYRILNAIDENQSCSIDSDCTLVAEEPFGQTVPLRMMSAKALLSDMKEFRKSCNNEARTGGYNAELVHVPACVRSRCMVKTSRKR